MSDISHFNETGKSAVAVGITLPEYVVKQIDEARGDVTRSRHILRLIQKAWRSKEQD